MMDVGGCYECSLNSLAFQNIETGRGGCYRCSHNSHNFGGGGSLRNVIMSCFCTMVFRQGCAVVVLL